MLLSTIGRLCTHCVSPPLVNHPGEPSLEENLWDYKHNNRPPDEMR